jgi:hypothetical protein
VWQLARQGKGREREKERERERERETERERERDRAREGPHSPSERRQHPRTVKTDLYAEKEERNSVQQMFDNSHLKNDPKTCMLASIAFN